MNHPTTAATHALSSPAARHFIRHYLVMVVLMLAGMALLGPLESLLLDPIGWDDLRSMHEFDALVMATNMTIPMVTWMLVRGHAPGTTWLMAAVMYLPFLLLLPLDWAGVMGYGAVLSIAHTLMFLGMLGVMWVRREEFTGHGEH